MALRTMFFLKLLGLIFLFSYVLRNPVFAQKSYQSPLVDLDINKVQLVEDTDELNLQYTIKTKPLPSKKIISDILAFDTLRSNVHFQNEFKGFSSVHKPRKGVQVVSKTEGLPNNYVFDLVMDPNRNIWIAQDILGLVQFDGEKFSVFSEPNGLVSDRVLRLSPKGDYGVWVLTMDGISAFDGAIFNNWYFNEPFDYGYFTDLVSSEETLWVGTKGEGLWKVSPGNIEVFNTSVHGLSGNHITDLMLDKDQLWIAYANGSLNCIVDEEIREYQFSEPLSNPLISKTLDGDILLYSNTDSRLYYLGDKSCSGIDLDINEPISKVLSQENGSLWFISVSDKVYMLKDEALFHFDASDGLPPQAINAGVFIEDDLWLGHAGGGMSVFRSVEYTFLEQEKSNLGNLYTNFVSSKGRVYLGGDNKVIRITEEGQSRISNLTGKTGGFNVTAFSEDKEGNVWCSTYEGELFKESGKSFVHVQSLSDGDKLGLMDMDFDRKGNLWLATFKNGLYCLDALGVLTKQDLDIRFDEDIIAVELDKYDRLWIGTQVGLYRQMDEGFKRYDLSNFPYEDILSLYVDSQGGVWIGAKRGVAYYDGEVFRFLNRGTGLLSDHIFAFSEDESGRIWCVAETGLNIIENVQDWNDLKVNSFSFEDGFNETDTYYGTTVVDAEGRLWIIGTNGLIVLETDQLISDNEERAIVSLDQVFVNGIAVDFFQLTDSRSRKVYQEVMKENIDLENVKLKGKQSGRFSEKISLPHTLNSLSFSYSARHWSSYNDLEYRYRLSGLDEEWSKPTLENRVSFWKLKAGRSYIFEVQSRIHGGTWTEAESFEFKIRSNWPLIFTWLTFFVLILVFVVFTFRGLILEKISFLHKKYYPPKEDEKRSLDQVEAPKTNDKLKSVHDLALAFAHQMAFYGKLSNRIRQLSKNLEEKDQGLAKSMESDIRAQSDVADLWERFMQEFDKLYPDFSEAIRLSFSDLSEREIKICVLVVSGLSNSQIANIMLIQADSVKKSRHRINKKINQSNIDLSSFLITFLQKKVEVV